MQVKVRKLHILYEDDIYQMSPDKKFAFGFTLDSFYV